MWLIINLRRMPPNGAAGLSFQELRKFLKACISFHILVLVTHEATLFIFESCGRYITSNMIRSIQ